MKLNRLDPLGIALSATIAATLGAMALASAGCGGGGGSAAAVKQFLLALTDTGKVYAFPEDNPGAATLVATLTDTTNVPILPDGLDYQSNSDVLFVADAAAGAMDWYRVNLTNGQCTLIASDPMNPAGPTGVSFEPTVSRFTVMQSGPPYNSTFAFNNPSAIPGSAVSGFNDLGDIAHTGQTPTSATTICYAVDPSIKQLKIIGSTAPSVNPAHISGVATVVGNLGLAGTFDPEAGFDIGLNQGIGFLAMTMAGSSRLYTVSLATGQATFVGAIAVPPGEKVVGLCVRE